MRQIAIQNPSVTKTYKTFLDAAYTAGSTTLTVKSNVSFAANDLAVVQLPTEELAELQQIASLTGLTTINLSNTGFNFNHPKEASLYKVLWNFVSLEANYGSGFSVITSSSIQWDSKSNETLIYDSNGNDQTQYRFRFYNSVTLLYSEYSPTITGAQPLRTSVTFMISESRRVGGDPLKKFVTDDELIRQFNRAQEIVYAKNSKWWFLYVDTYLEANPIPAVAQTNHYSFAQYTDFGHLDSIRYRYTNGNVDILYQLKMISAIEFDARFRNLNKARVDYVRFYKFLPVDTNSGAGYFMVDPTPLNSNIGNFYPNYYKKMTDLSSVSDTTLLPYPSLLEDFAIAYILRVRGDIAKAEEYEKRFYGPTDRTLAIEMLSGLALLEQIDKNQKSAQSQPRHLMKWRGQKAMSMLFGENLTASPDYLRETYFDSRTGG